MSSATDVHLRVPPGYLHVRHAAAELTTVHDFDTADDIPAEVLPSHRRRLAIIEAALLVEDDTLSLYGS